MADDGVGDGARNEELELLLLARGATAREIEGLRDLAAGSPGDKGKGITWPVSPSTPPAASVSPEDGVIATATDIATPAPEEAPTVSPAEKRRRMHVAELRNQIAKTLGPGGIHTRYDESRTIHQAWFGNSWDKAEYRGEWNTEVGALRKLRNSRGPRQVVPDAPNAGYSELRPYPSNGSTQSIDAVMMRRQHRNEASPMWWVWLKRVVALLFIVAAAFGGGALWFADRISSRRPTQAPARALEREDRPALEVPAPGNPSPAAEIPVPTPVGEHRGGHSRSGH